MCSQFELSVMWWTRDEWYEAATSDQNEQNKFAIYKHKIWTLYKWIYFRVYSSESCVHYKYTENIHKKFTLPDYTDRPILLSLNQ